MLAIQELGCFQLPGIVYRSLQYGAVHYHAEHEMMVVEEWHNIGPQDLVTVSLSIKNAINKMHLCLLSIIYACPYHNSTTIRIIDDKTLMRTTSMQMSFPETVSDSLGRNSLLMQTDCCSSCPGDWSQTILEVKMLDVEVLGWCGYTWSAVVRRVGCTAKSFETPLEMAYGRHSIHGQQLWWTFLQSACQLHAPSKLVTSVALCCVIKLHILEWSFIVVSLRHTCAIIMLSNQPY